jgi:hypothetical protein
MGYTRSYIQVSSQVEFDMFHAINARRLGFPSPLTGLGRASKTRAPCP